MLQNYIKIALRRLRKSRAYTFINIGGLVAGITCFLLVALYVQDEYSFDRFHTKSERIYRVTGVTSGLLTNSSTATNNAEIGRVPVSVASMLLESFPEIEAAARIESEFGSKLMHYREQRFYEENIYYTEPAFFDLFDVRLVAGDAANGLERPFTLFISDATAQKYFGQEDPLGKTIRMENEQDYEVTGVFEKMPHNSRFQYDFLLSLASRYEPGEENWKSDVETYALLKEGHSVEDLAQKLPAFFEPYKEASRIASGYIAGLALMPLTDIHLYGRERLKGSEEALGDIRYIYLFSSIGFLVLFIACINYVNLTTARSARRGREVGVRKAVGAQRKQIIWQFLGESVLLSALAVGMAVALTELLLPSFNHLAGRELQLNYGGGFETWGLLVGVVLGISLLSGLYPAFYFSRFQPVHVLKNAVAGHSRNRLQQGLVVFQFAVSVGLILATIIIERQLHYVQTKNLGFDKEQVVTIRALNRVEQPAAFKTALLQHPGVEQVTVSAAVPGESYGVFVMEAENIEGYQGELDRVMLQAYPIDEDFHNTLGLEIVTGRMLSPDFGLDTEEAVLVNEAAVRKFGWENPIGKTLSWGASHRVVGVVRDFHYATLKGPIDPLILYLSDIPLFVSARINTDDLRGTLDFLEKTWNTFVPAYPFEYTFLDDKFDAMYRAEERLGQLFGLFALLTIVIACLGLFGLAAFTAEQRTKEIGVRKVWGASIPSLILLLSKEFAQLVLIALLVGLPLAYFGMNRWLQDFAYRIDINWGLFVIASIVVFFIALVTVSYQTLQAARANPIDTLRYE